ncbi:MAG: ATP synthase F1 subunit epsilon [Clostridia bacterium]|nr:ATP synthase F1 subunit epsilon [Clostridia bacterium]MBQ8794879.1 ATP synthase F1 subunit epsilon [Clostridia bacterium]
MKSFNLKILTPERAFYIGESTSLVVPISDGMLGIMAYREPVTASVTYGEASYTTPEGKKVQFSVSGGMLDAVDNNVTLLCDYALLPEEIDEEKERRAEEEALRELRKSKSDKDYQLSRIMLKNAINNLKIKQKHSLN